jgi:hypothetical protein
MFSLAVITVLTVMLAQAAASRAATMLNLEDLPLSLAGRLLLHV